MTARNRAFDRGWLSSKPGVIPTLAVGNLTVGGTGKTPLAGWLAATLRARGLRVAIVLRGYGGDEVEVHRFLNRSIPVLVEPDRVAGVRRARDAGADVAVLDDAFQHRYLRASAAIVLIAAEDWTEVPRLLPRGPWREPLSALRRATLVVVTRKSASAERGGRVADQVARRVPGVAVARAEIALAGLARFRAEPGLAETVPLQGFEGGAAVAGVANPESVWAQLEDAGVSVERRLAFPDHHRYSPGELALIKRACSGAPLVTTLKDAVKLGPALGGAVAIYVLLQRVVWEAGEEEVEGLIAKVSGGLGRVNVP